MTFHLVKGEPLSRGLRRIATEQVDIALSDLADEQVPMHRKVHSLRIRCKKLRGLLRLYRPLMGDDYRREDRRLRAIAKQVAGNRDRDVCIKTAAALDGSVKQKKFVRQAVSEETIARSREALRRSLDDVKAWPFNLHGFYDTAPGFAWTYRKCIHAWKIVLNDPHDEDFHRLRRWTKYHWYHIRILERLNRKQLRRRRRQLRKLQLTLGDAHDLVTLQGFLALNADPSIPLLRKAINRKHDLYAHAIKSGRKLFAVSVDDLVADVSRYWADWRR